MGAGVGDRGAAGGTRAGQGQDWSSLQGHLLGTAPSWRLGSLGGLGEALAWRNPVRCSAPRRSSIAGTVPFPGRGGRAVGAWDLGGGRTHFPRLAGVLVTRSCVASLGCGAGLGSRLPVVGLGPVT